MVRTKKAKAETARDRQEISEVHAVVDEIAEGSVVIAEHKTEETKPTLFISDQQDTYRTMLLERPVMPVLTNMQEAVKFAGEYEKWNIRVQLNLK